MDLVGACRAFVHVSERGSFTLGASAARVPQPVASRRIAALEKHLGGPLFDRSTRRAMLTQFGRDMLPSAKRLVRLADAMEYDAETAKLRPMRVAVPEICSTRDLALLDVEARRHDIVLDFRPAPPADRAELLHTQQVTAAITATPSSEGLWAVPLGLACSEEPRAETVYVETLRTGRTELPSRGRRVWIQPEDDVPHVRDPVTRIGDAVGLQPAQVVVASALTSALAAVLDSDDFLLASARQASELGLHWRPIGEVRVTRGFTVSATDPHEQERIRDHLRGGIARCLGVPDGHEATM